MRLVSSITSSSMQKFFFYTEDGIEVEFHLRFLPTQKAWILDVFCDGFSAKGIKVSVSKNILDKFRNIISFGVMILTENGVDPFQVTDFEDGSAMFIFLEDSEKDIVGEFLDGKAK